jgi:hypothetical protein
MRTQEGPLIGGLRVVAIYENEDDGSITLKPDNGMSGQVLWSVPKDMLRRINIGDRIIMEAPAKWYPLE